MYHQRSIRTATHYVLLVTVIIAHIFTGYALAQTQDNIEWQSSAHSRSRLLIGEKQTDGTFTLAILIELDPSYKTYWRSPGDSGLAPVITTQGSENLASLEVRWPAPKRFTDASGTINGFDKTLLLPLIVTAKDPSQSIYLIFKMDYGVCFTQCIPTSVTHTLKLPPLQNIFTGADARLIREALKKTPLRVTDAEQIRSLIVNVGVHSFQNKTVLKVDLHPHERETAIFVEAPEKWVLGLPQRLAAPAAFFGSRNETPVTYLVPIEYRPILHDSQTTQTFRFTLQSSGDAYELEQSVDTTPDQP
jgi:DsbC/DsbD-like thiol-disulfide interchange protein